MLQIRLGNFVQDLGYVSYVDHSPQFGLVFGLVFGFAVPVIVIVLLICVFCVRRKRRAAYKQRRPIVIMNDRGRRNDRVGNSYIGQSQPQTTELLPLQSPPAAEVSARDEELAKGDWTFTLLLPVDRI